MVSIAIASVIISTRRVTPTRRVSVVVTPTLTVSCMLFSMAASGSRLETDSLSWLSADGSEESGPPPLPAPPPPAPLNGVTGPPAAPPAEEYGIIEPLFMPATAADVG